MKWSDLSYSREFYIPFDEFQKVVRGFLLASLNVDLENIPRIFFEPFTYFKSQQYRSDKGFTDCNECKIYLSEIVGSSYEDYSNISIIEAFMRIKRAPSYILQGRVTRNKYFSMLKKSVYMQECPIVLTKNHNNQYFVDCNGNHRVIMYKIMMLAEIANKYEWARSDSYNLNYKGFNDIRKKYWLKAFVREFPDINGEH